MRQYLLLLAIVFGSNLLWEIAQTPLYHGANIFGSYVPSSLSNPSYWSIVLLASLGDVVYISLIYLLVAYLRKDFLWFTYPKISDLVYMIFLSLTCATLIEWRGISGGRWSYSAFMPIVPLLHVGFSPFMQLACTSVISLFLTKRVFARATL